MRIEVVDQSHLRAGRGLFEPSPVMVPGLVSGGAAAIASCPFPFSFSTTFDPIKPVPPQHNDLHDSQFMTVSRTKPLATGIAFKSVRRIRRRTLRLCDDCGCTGS